MGNQTVCVCWSFILDKPTHNCGADVQLPKMEVWFHHSKESRRRCVLYYDHNGHASSEQETGHQCNTLVLHFMKKRRNQLWKKFWKLPTSYSRLAFHFSRCRIRNIIRSKQETSPSHGTQWASDLTIQMWAVIKAFFKKTPLCIQPQALWPIPVLHTQEG